MLSSNSETESAAAPFPAPADLFLPDNPTAKQKIRFLKPIFSAEMLANPPIMLTLRKCKLRKLSHSVGTESQGWKAPCIVQDGIPRLESFLHRAGRNPKAGKLPASCRTESQGWKAFCNVQDGIPAINRRGVLHTPEYIHNDKWAHSGRMRYAPTSTLFINH